MGHKILEGSLTCTLRLTCYIVPMTTTTNATEIRQTIAAIKAAAYGMGHEPNAGQALRIARLEAQLAEYCEGHADGPHMGETFFCDGTCRA